MIGLSGDVLIPNPKLFSHLARTVEYFNDSRDRISHFCYGKSTTHVVWNYGKCLTTWSLNGGSRDFWEFSIHEPCQRINIITIEWVVHSFYFVGG